MEDKNPERQVIDSSRKRQILSCLAGVRSRITIRTGTMIITPDKVDETMKSTRVPLDEVIIALDSLERDDETLRLSRDQFGDPIFGFAIARDFTKIDRRLSKEKIGRIREQITEYQNKQLKKK